MSKSKRSFEEIIIRKLSTKGKNLKTIEEKLLNAFRQFDLEKKKYCTKDNFVNVISSLGIKSFDKDSLENLFCIYSGNKILLNYNEFVGTITDNKVKHDSLNKNINVNSLAKSLDKYNNNLSYVVTDSKKKKNFLEKTTHVFFNENDNRYVENKLHNFNKSLPQNPDCFKKSILDKMKFSTTKSFKLSGFPTKGNSNLSLNKMNETIKNNKNNNQRSKFCLTQKKQLKGNFTKFFNKDNENFNRTKEKLQFISMHDSAKSIFESEKPNKNITIDFLSSPKASPVNHKFVHKAKSLNYFTQVQKNLLKFREKLFNRGGKTIFSLSKQFKIFDSNNDKIISFSEFLNAIKIYKIDLSFKESDELFKYFDKDKKGYINYEEFLGNLIEDMNERRYNLVLNIFNQIDKEKKGFIDLDTIKFLYDAKSHPGVISKKKKEDQILNEFLQTFELHHKNFKSTEKNIQLSKTLVSKRKEKSISLNEFIAYYNSISISIESDDYFEEILNNSWRLKKSFQDQLNQSAWVKEFNLKKIVSSPIMIQNHNLELCSPDVFQLKRREYYKLLKKKSSFRLDPWEANSDHGINYDGKTEKIIPRKKPISVEVVDYSRRNSNREDVFIKFKNKLLSRGIREISSISKLFKISDKNKNFKIEFNEFNRICKEYNIGLEDDEIRYLFNKFDIDGSGDISFDEFLKCFIGGMNQFRINLIKKIFEKIDANHNGIIDIDDIKSIFNGKMHPDVKSGKIMEEQALEQFLKVFDINSNKKNNEIKVDFETFCEYYNNISVSIENDIYFEEILNRVWNLSNSELENRVIGEN